MRNIALWIIDNVPLGQLSPYVFAYGIGCSDFKKKKEGENINKEQALKYD